MECRRFAQITVAVLFKYLGGVDGLVGRHVEEQRAKLRKARQCVAGQHAVQIDRFAQRAVGETAAQACHPLGDGLHAFHQQFARP
jgi:hypothetical protein